MMTLTSHFGKILDRRSWGPSRRVSDRGFAQVPRPAWLKITFWVGRGHEGAQAMWLATWC